MLQLLQLPWVLMQTTQPPKLIRNTDLQLCEVPCHGRQVPVLVVTQVQHLQPHKVAYATCQATQPVAGHQQLLECCAASHYPRHAGQAVAAAVQHLQAPIAAQCLRQGLQPVAGQAQHLGLSKAKIADNTSEPDIIARCPTPVQHAQQQCSTSCASANPLFATSRALLLPSCRTRLTLSAVRLASSSGTAAL